MPSLPQTLIAVAIEDPSKQGRARWSWRLACFLLIALTALVSLWFIDNWLGLWNHADP